MHQLYRHFDRYGRLLYVGISVSALGRLAQHKHSADWYKEISSISIENYDTRRELEKAEIEAIRKERPVHNIRHTRPNVEIQVKAEDSTKVIRHTRETCVIDEDCSANSEYYCEEF